MVQPERVFSGMPIPGIAGRLTDGEEQINERDLLAFSSSRRQEEKER